MEQTIQVFIYIHILFGIKGSTIHKKMGQLFSLGMLSNALIAIPISWLPNHKNLFLCFIGLFTIYLVITGNNALEFKIKSKANWKDTAISSVMLILSVVMLAVGVFGVLNGAKNSILYLFFGCFGLVVSMNDFKFYKKAKRSKNAWLTAHLGKMIGALIASITAFIVTGIGIGNLIAWIAPTVLGTCYIYILEHKIKSKP
jgi:cytochrome b561